MTTQPRAGLEEIEERPFLSQAGLVVGLTCLAQFMAALLSGQGGGVWDSLNLLGTVCTSTLLAWFLLGFANLALQPQRIEYLSQPKHGFDLTPGSIVLIVGVTSELGRFCPDSVDTFTMPWT